MDEHSRRVGLYVFSYFSTEEAAITEPIEVMKTDRKGVMSPRSAKSTRELRRVIKLLRFGVTDIKYDSCKDRTKGVTLLLG